MNERWKKITVILDDGTQNTGWINMARVTLVVPHADGSILEITTGFAYKSVEPPMYFLPNDGSA